MTTAPVRVLQWKPLAEKYATASSVLKPEEILAIIWSESTGNPKAVNPADPSYGLMQITIPLARHYGLFQGDQIGFENTELLFDPDTNVKIGSAFLTDLKTKYSVKFPITDPNIAWIAAYNEGEPNLWKHRPDPGYISAFLSHLKDLGGTPA